MKNRLASLIDDVIDRPSMMSKAELIRKLMFIYEEK